MEEGVVKMAVRGSELYDRWAGEMSRLVLSRGCCCLPPAEIGPDWQGELAACVKKEKNRKTKIIKKTTKLDRYSEVIQNTCTLKLKTEGIQVLD